MKNVVLVVVIALVLGGYYYMNSNKPADDTTAGESTTQEATEKKMAPVESETSMAVGDVKEFTVVGSEMKFDVSEITVNKGDTVKIIFKNGGKYPHDWVVDEFNARTQVIKPEETEVITFVADQVGTFEYYCSVMQHRAQGMVGKLIVE